MNKQSQADLCEFSYCPWSIRDVFIVFVYSIALFFVFSFWLTVLYFLVNMVAGKSFYAVFSALMDLKGNEHFYAVLLFYLALFIAMKAKIFKKYNIKEVDFFVKAATIRSDVAYGVMMYLKFALIVILFVFLGFLVTAMWDLVFATNVTAKVNVFFASYQQEVSSVQDKTWGVVGIGILFLLAPFFEELFFRGCLYRALRARFSRFLAIIMSSFVFSFVHGYFFLFIYVFLVGLLLAYMYEKRGSLVAPLAFHMLNNIAVALLFMY